MGPNMNISSTMFVTSCGKDQGVSAIGICTSEVTSTYPIASGMMGFEIVGSYLLVMRPWAYLLTSKARR